MVVPFTKEGEDIRQVLEADVNKRSVLTELHLKSFVSNFGVQFKYRTLSITG